MRDIRTVVQSTLLEKFDWLRFFHSGAIIPLQLMGLFLFASHIYDNREVDARLHVDIWGRVTGLGSSAQGSKGKAAQNLKRDATFQSAYYKCRYFKLDCVPSTLKKPGFFR